MLLYLLRMLNVFYFLTLVIGTRIIANLACANPIETLLHNTLLI